MTISFKRNITRLTAAFVFAVATVTSFVAFNGSDASAAGATVRLINNCPSSTGVTVSWGSGSFRTTVAKYSSVTRSIPQYKTITVRSDQYRHNGSFYTPYAGPYSWTICG